MRVSLWNQQLLLISYFRNRCLKMYMKKPEGTWQNPRTASACRKLAALRDGGSCSQARSRTPSLPLLPSSYCRLASCAPGTTWKNEASTRLPAAPIPSSAPRERSTSLSHFYCQVEEAFSLTHAGSGAPRQGLCVGPVASQ